MIIGPFKATLTDIDGEEQILEFCGEQFKIAKDVGGMPLLEFAYAAKSGVDAAEMDGLAAMYSMIEDCLMDGEWSRFRQTAKKNKASVALLMEVCTSIYAALSARPTTTAPSSPDGSQPTETGQDSTPTSSVSPESTMGKILASATGSED